MPRLRWLLAAVLVILVGLALFGLPLWGKAALRLLPADVQVQADSVGGPLWAPRLTGATLQLKGLNARAASGGVSLGSIDFRKHTLRLNVSLKDAVVDADLKQLFGGTQTKSAWTVLPGRLNVQNVRLNVNGKGLALPNAEVRISGEGERLKVQATTAEGGLRADVHLDQGAQQLTGTADVLADAKLINLFWKGAVKGGLFTGRYRFGQTIVGDLKLSGGRIEVPGAEVVKVSQVTGVVTQRGNLITTTLNGLGLGGPVSAQGRVDLDKPQWTVSATADPTAKGLAAALGTTGSGKLHVTANAGGWNSVDARASATGSGEIAGVGFSGLDLKYVYGKDRSNRVQLNTALAALGGQQRLNLDWEIGVKGSGGLTGDLLNTPLNLKANLAGNRVALTGEALGGPATLRYDFGSRSLNADLAPALSGLKAKLSATGKPEDLALTVASLEAGTLRFSGSGRLNAQGERLDLATSDGGSIRLALNKQFRGSWNISGLNAYSVGLDGSGRVDVPNARLTGTLAAKLPGDSDRLSGPLDVNIKTPSVSWQTGRGLLSYEDQTVRAQLNNLRVAGLTTSGSLRAVLGGAGLPKVYGTLSANGTPGRLSLNAQGEAVALEGRVQGIRVTGRTRLVEGFPTQLSAAGGALQASLNVADGVNVTLRTGNETARASLQGQQVMASGRVDLSALRTLTGLPDLKGTLELLPGGGRAVNARLSASTSGVQASVSGRVYPDVAVSGRVSASGQTVQASVSGPYDRLGFTATGTTAPLSASGVTLPAQALNLRGTLTPKLSAQGTLGGVALRYANGQVLANGTLALEANGQPGKLRLNASYGPNWTGRVSAGGQAGDYRVTLNGPWRDLQLSASGPQGLRARGSVNAATLSYQARVTGQVQGLYLDATVRGQRAEFSVNATASDGAGGTARISGTSLSDLRANFAGLQIAGQTFNGRLSTVDGKLNGTLTAGAFRLNVVRGRIAVGGELSGTRIDATANLTLPATLTNVNLRASGVWGTAFLTGSGRNLSGRLNLAEQRRDMNGVPLRLPAQSVPLRASLTPLQASAGGLTYSGGSWSGRLNLRYVAATSGRLTLIGDGSTLAAQASGPLTGRVSLLPSLGGELRARLSPVVALLPQQFRTATVPGELRVLLAPTSARASLVGTRYVGEVLSLDAQADWRNGLRASGVLRQTRTRLPFVLAGQTLSVSGARLDGRALRPVLAGAAGAVTADLNLPDFDWQRATGTVNVNLTAQGQAARGRVTLAGGQFSADLHSSLGGRAVAVTGLLYPRADARLKVDQLRGQLGGSLDSGLTLSAAGPFEGRDVSLSARYTSKTLNLDANVAGARLLGQAVNGPSGWTGSLNLNAPDLQALTGSAGRLSGSVSGSLKSASGTLSGEVAGASLNVPVAWDGSNVQVNSASAKTAFASVAASGAVYPSLNVSGTATLSDYLPGQFGFTASGPLAAPGVQARGVLSATPRGLQAAGSRITARLSGRDYLVQASGETLAGQARGQLGSGPLGGLQTARFTLHTRYVLSETEAVRPDGVIGWNARTGFLGNLAVTGRAGGQDLNLRLTGNGPLALTGRAGPGTLDGTLGRNLLLAPDARLKVSNVDVGGLWGRPGQLGASGQVVVNGSWNAPRATVAGDLTDTGGDLSGTISGEYAAGRAKLRLNGSRLTADASLNGGQVQADLNASGVRLARVLPPSLNISQLDLSGAATLDAGGPDGLLVRARNLNLQGAQQNAGAFTAQGSLEYSERAISGNLRVAALGGTLVAAGALPQGVQLAVTKLDLSKFGAGEVNGSVRLTGAARDPSLSGRVALSRPEVGATLDLTGHLLAPTGHLSATLRGAYSGQLYADLHRVSVSPLSADLRLYGAATQGSNRVSLDLSGTWPRLAGQASAQISALKDPVTLRGDGQGNYQIGAGRGGTGTIRLSGTDLLPQLSAQLNLNPLALVDAEGTGTLGVTASGPLNALTVNVNGQLRGVQRSGVSLGDLAITGGGPLSDLRAELRQSGLGAAEGVVARYQGGAATLSGLRAQLAGTTVSATGSVGTDGVKAALEASGTVSGTLNASYQQGAVQASGNVTASGAKVQLRVAADQKNGWSGGGTVSGLPASVVTRDLSFRVKGALASPQLTGDLGLLGAEASLTAGTSGVTLVLADGTDVKASGQLRLTTDRLSGQLSLSRKEGQLRLSLAGTPGSPAATVNAALGGWTASGTLGLKAGQLALGDGERSGTLAYADGRARVNLPGLDLTRLKLVQVAGRLSANGDLALDGQSGQLSLTVAGLTTGGTLPVVELPLRGDVSATVTARGGTYSAAVTLVHPNGTARANLTYAKTLSGTVTARLSKDSGTLSADLALGANGVTGQLTVGRFPLRAMGLTERLDAQVGLTGQDFTVNASLAGDAGQASAQGGGSLADLYPPLEGLLGLQSSGAGYRIDARLSALDLKTLKIGPYLEGSASASATISDGGTNFVVRADDLSAAGAKLPTRIEGNSFEGQYRLRGNVGDSQLFGSVQGGTLTGRLVLQALPVSNLIGALAGPLPGSALVTGVTRFELPLADPLSGSAEVVAERVATRGGGQSLTGSGVLSYRDRELRSLNLQLSGAGTWNVQGQYTRQKVDLRAVLSGTDFTPLLSLVPALQSSSPTLKGDLSLNVTGTYDKPQASLSTTRFQGKLGDETLAGLNLGGSLIAGRFSAQGAAVLTGTVASRVQLRASGTLENGALTGTQLSVAGPLALRDVSSFSNLIAVVKQEGSRWTLDATATQGGSARVTGTLAPTLDLRIAARNFAPQLAFIYGRETLMNGDLSVTTRGQDYVVGGALSLNRLVLGSVATPPGTEAPTTATTATSTDQAADSFVSPLPPELTTFPTKNGETPPNPLLSRIVLDNIPILLPNGARIDESLIRADLTGRLTLAGRASDLRITGNASVLRGNVFLRENEFAIRQGNATFDGLSAFPTFAVQAQGIVPDAGAQVGVGVDLSGSFPPDTTGKRALKLDTRLRCVSNCLANGHDYTGSNPVAESQLYALVALGTPDIGTLPGDLTGLGASALRTALSVFVLGQVERGLAQAFGLDSFRIRTNLLGGTGGTATGDSTEFSVGSYLNRDLFLQYTIGLSGKGLIDATYTTPDSRFTFRVSSPLTGLNLATLRPSFSLGYNFTPLSSVTLGVENSQSSTTFKLGYGLRF